MNGWGFLTGEGNGNPLQYPCLENPVDKGAWWAAVHGVTKSRTRLKQFSSSSSSSGGFLRGPVVKNLPCNTKDNGSVSGPGRSHMPWSN